MCQKYSFFFFRVEIICLKNVLVTLLTTPAKEGTQTLDLKATRFKNKIFLSTWKQMQDPKDEDRSYMLRVEYIGYRFKNVSSSGKNCMSLRSISKNCGHSKPAPIDVADYGLRNGAKVISYCFVSFNFSVPKSVTFWWSAKIK